MRRGFAYARGFVWVWPGDSLREGAFGCLIDRSLCGIFLKHGRRPTGRKEAPVAKKIEGYIKLQVPAGSATPSPPIGPALGQRGVNIMEFCKAFNAATQDMEKAMPIPTIITVYADRSFTFVTKTPPASFLIKKAMGLKSGSKEPGKVSAGTIKRSQLAEIATAKMADLNANDLEAATRIIEGSARAMGLEVVEG